MAAGKGNVYKLIGFALVMFVLLAVVLFAPAHHPANDDTGAQLVRDFFASAPAPNCPSKTWTTEELRNHAAESNLLILVHGYVLNVTDFLPHHPGGKALLAGASGVDAAEVFTQFHQSSTTSLFSSFCVGHAKGVPAPPKRNG